MAGADPPRNLPRNPPSAADPHRPGLDWQCLPFAQVPTPMLYQVLALRSRVFVLEQRCLYEDMDGADIDAWLLAGSLARTGQVLATARILPPRARFAEPSIGRVCLDPGWRGRGWGRLLMDFAIGCVRESHPGLPIRISAQAYLQAFYTSLGFENASDPYLEDGIPHLEMLLAARPPGAST
jgi:ElaA protein